MFIHVSMILEISKRGIAKILSLNNREMASALRWTVRSNFPTRWPPHRLEAVSYPKGRGGARSWLASIPPDGAVAGSTGEENEEGRNGWSLIGLAAAAYAQPRRSRSRPVVLRRAESPAGPARQGCSAAVAPARPLRGCRGVFGKKTRKDGSNGRLNLERNIPCISSRSIRAR